MRWQECDSAWRILHGFQNIHDDVAGIVLFRADVREAVERSGGPYDFPFRGVGIASAQIGAIAAEGTCKRLVR